MTSLEGSKRLAESQKLTDYSFYSWAHTVADYVGENRTAVASRVAESALAYCQASCDVDELIKRDILRIEGDPRHNIHFMYEHCFTDSSAFFKVARTNLVDMAMHPEERSLLKAIACGLQKKFIKTDIVRARGHHGVSCAEHFTYKNYGISLGCKVHIRLQPGSFSLCRDLEGDLHLEKPSFRRTLTHELLHVFNRLTERSTKFEELPKTKRWTSAHEEAVITGETPGAVKEF